MGQWMWSFISYILKELEGLLSMQEDDRKCWQSSTMSNTSPAVCI